MPARKGATPVTVFSALGDDVRLRLVDALRGGAKPVHALAALFDISRPAISRHLKVLKEAGLVREIKSGRENLYEMIPRGLDGARRWLGDPERKVPAPANPQARKRNVRAEPTTAPGQATTPAPSTPPKPQLSLFD